MDQKLQLIFNKIKKEALTDEERDRMRSDLRLFVADHPVQRSFADSLREWARAAREPFAAVPLLLRPLPAALAALLCVGVGASYAAEGALPGDLLYAVKINVNEEVRGAFALSDPARAGWKAAQLSRRLQEAEALAVRGDLTPLAGSDLEAKLDATSEAFDASVRSIAAGGSAPVVVAAASSLEATLEEHASALATLADTVPASKGAVESLRGKVRAKAEKAARVKTVAAAFAEAESATHETAEVADVDAARANATMPPAARLTVVAAPAPAPATTSPEEAEGAAGISPYLFEAAIRAAQEEDGSAATSSAPAAKAAGEEESE